LSARRVTPAVEELPEQAGQYWDVHRCDPVLGVGRRLERVQAETRAAAELLAHGRHGADVLVTLACRDKRRDASGRTYRRAWRGKP
jgi:hypothetical protein